MLFVVDWGLTGACDLLGARVVRLGFAENCRREAGVADFNRDEDTFAENARREDGRCWDRPK